MINKIPDYLTEIALPLPITETARKTAQTFAAAQATPEKAEQVKLNTIAVLVVNNYLNMLGVTTDLTQSDSWNPVLQMCANVADLEVKGVGKLECRPLKEITSIYSIPEAPPDLRIGYVIVAIDDSLRQAHILGFIQTLTNQQIALNRLQAPEDLIDRILELNARESPLPTTSPLTETVHNLSQWLDDIFTTGWETVESIFGTTQLAPAFSFRGVNTLAKPESDLTENRAVLRRGKLIDLGKQIDREQVVLLVELQAESDNKTGICLQLHPIGEQRYLPANMKLIVLDESGAVFMEAQARRTDNYLQLQFSGVKGENFTVKVALNDALIIEKFVI